MKIKSISKHVLAIVLSLAVLASTLMLNTFSAFAEATSADPSVWDGNLDNLPAELSLLNEGEENSPENPYLIQTAADFVYFGKQLDKVGNNTKHKHYRLTTDIYFNDITPGESGEWYEKENLNDWLTTLAFTTDQQGFQGTLDGDGHVIHGIYINTTKQYASIFGYMQGYGAAIKNLGVEDSYIKSTNSDAYVGVFAGNTHNWIGGDVVFENCYAADSVILEGKRTSGIIANTQINANGNNYKLIFRNCISSATLNGTSGKAAYLGAWYYAINVSVENCYSTQSGVVPINSINGSNATTNAETISKTFKNCFTFQYSKYWNGSINVDIKDGVTLLSTLDTITGISARKSMSGFDFVNDWFAEEGKLPQIRCFVDTSSAKEASEWWKVWDGTVPSKPEGVADDALWNKANVPFDGGDGTTAATAYEISTPEQLAYLCTYANWYTGGKYFKLTDDIYLNDVSVENWTENTPNEWKYPSPDPLFYGHLDGNGHTVYGLYINGDLFYTGLIWRFGNGGSVENLKISKSYVKTTRWDGQHGVLIGTTWGNTTVKNCVIDDTIELTASNYAAPLIGGIQSNQTANVTVQDCYVAAKVSKIGSDSHFYGFLGRNSTTNAYPLVVNSSYYVGDFDLAYPVTDYAPTFTDCYTTKVYDTENGETAPTGVTAGSNLEAMKAAGLTAVLNVFPKLGNVNGDANADVDICDLVILKKFDLGMGVNIDIYSSDVNNDREINGMDFVALKRYILDDASVFQ